MVCTFFGRRNAPSSVKEKLSEAINDLIKRGYDEFYVGNNGNFDFYVQSVLSDIIKTNCKVSFTVVLSRPDEKAILAEQIFTLFPDGLEKVPHRFAISKRNDWLIKKAQVVVAYADNRFTNSHKWIEKAKNKGIDVINLANQENRRIDFD